MDPVVIWPQEREVCADTDEENNKDIIHGIKKKVIYHDLHFTAIFIPPFPIKGYNLC